jgi:parallel beta-helix repeat protein
MNAADNQEEVRRIGRKGIHLRYHLIAIRMQYSKGCTFRGNIVSNASNTAISIGESLYPLVSDNNVYIVSNGQGIALTACEGGQVSNNNVYRSGQNGIGIYNSTLCEVTGNVLIGSGALSDATTKHGCIHVNAGSSSVSVAGNKAAMASSGAQAGYGLYISSGATGIQRFGNDFRGSGTVTSIQDSSTSPVTSSGDAV